LVRSLSCCSGPWAASAPEPLDSWDRAKAASLLLGIGTFGSRLEPLTPFPLTSPVPLASPARFSRSVPEPGRAPPTGRKPLGRYQDISEPIPEDGSAALSTCSNLISTLPHSRLCSPRSTCLPASSSRLLSRSSLPWFGISDLIAGPPSSPVQSRSTVCGPALLVTQDLSKTSSLRKAPRIECRVPHSSQAA